MPRANFSQMLRLDFGEEGLTFFAILRRLQHSA